jgi:hypothetical protein
MLKGKLIHNGKTVTVNIPQSFEEITFADYCRIIELEDAAEAILSIPSKGLGDYLPAFNNTIKFLGSKRQLRKATKYPEWINKIDIRKNEWGKLEKVKQILKNNEGVKEELIIEQLIKVYLPDTDLKTLPCGVGIGAMSVFFTKLNEFFKHYERLNDYEPDNDELRAGVRDLDKYGYFTTLMALTNDNPLLYEDMLKQPAGVIYRTLLIKFEQAQIQKKLNEIKSKK